MNTTISIEIFGHAQEAICSGCEGQACGSCSPGEKKATLDLVNEFSALVAASELCSYYTVAFYESTPENIKRLPDVQRLLSMAKLEPVVCID
ncbi:MAG TPA: hypothetical protein PLC54_01420, partial [Spirochaetales bacterium]|nr:hypothetical protein [Spirochaetales bacterium]